jgi:hypothetical protein
LPACTAEHKRAELKGAAFLEETEVVVRVETPSRKITVMVRGLVERPAAVVIACVLIPAIAGAFASWQSARYSRLSSNQPVAPPPPNKPDVDPSEKPPQNVGDDAIVVAPRFNYKISPRALGGRALPTGAGPAVAPSVSAPIMVNVTPRLPEGLAVFASLHWGSRYIWIGPAAVVSAGSTLYTFEPTPLRLVGVATATSVLVQAFVVSRALRVVDEETLGLSSIFGRSEFWIQVPAPTLVLGEICGGPASLLNAPTCEPLTLGGSGAYLLNDASETICIEARSVAAPSRPPLVLHGSANGNQWSAIADPSEPPPNGRYSFGFGLMRPDENDQGCGPLPRTLPLAPPELHPKASR